MYFPESFLRAQAAYEAREPDWPDDDEEEPEERDGADYINDWEEDEKAEKQAQLQLDQYLDWLYK